MEIKCIFLVVIAFVPQSSVGNCLPLIIELQDEMASGFSAIEAYNKIAVLEHRKAIIYIFDTLKYYLNHPKTKDRNENKEFSIEIAKNKTTIASINCFDATWKAVASVRPDALSDIMSLRKVWDYKAKELFDGIYTAITLAYGEQNKETRSKIDNIENMAISSGEALNADILSPFLKDEVTKAWVKYVEVRATFEYLQEIRAICAGVRTLMNRDKNAFDTMKAIQIEASDRSTAHLENIFSYLKTTLVGYYVIKAGSLGPTLPYYPHPGLGLPKYNYVLDDISTLINDYLNKIASGTQHVSSNDFCGFDALQEASLNKVLTGLDIIFSSIKTEFGKHDDENAAENHSSAINIARDKTFMNIKESIQILFDVIPMKQREISSAYQNGQRVAFDNVEQLIDHIFIGIRIAMKGNCNDSEVEIDAVEKAAISTTAIYLKGVFTVIRSSYEYQRRMEPFIQYVQTFSTSKVQNVVRKIFIEMRMLQAKDSFRNKTKFHDIGVSVIENGQKEAASELTAKNIVLFDTIQYLYTTLPPERDELLDLLLEIQFYNSLAFSGIRRAVDLIFATIDAFLPTVLFGNQNQISPEIQCNGSFTTETAMDAAYEAIKSNFEAVLNSYSIIVPEAPAPITNGRSAINATLMKVIRGIFNAIGLSVDSANTSQNLVKINAIKERVIYEIGMTNIAIFTALKTSRIGQPKIMNFIERGKKIIVPEYTNVFRAIFDAIETPYELKQIAGSSQSKPMIKDSFSQIKAAYMKALSAIQIKTEAEFDLTMILLSSLYSCETGIAVDSYTDAGI